MVVMSALLQFQTRPSHGVGKQFSSLTHNKLFDGGKWYPRKNEHHCQLPN